MFIFLCHFIIFFSKRRKSFYILFNIIWIFLTRKSENSNVNEILHIYKREYSSYTNIKFYQHQNFYKAAS